MKDVNVAAKKNDAAVATTESVGSPTLSVVKKDQLFQLISDLTHTELLERSGGAKELNMKQERMVAVDTVNAKLVFGKNTKGRIRDVLIEGQITGTATLVSTELDYKILVVFTNKRTYFVLLPGGKLFSFWIPMVSKNAQEAILNLIVNNLARGKDTFEKTAARLYPDALFLWELMHTVCPEDAVLEFELASAVRGEINKAPAKLFFYRNERAKTILSVGGYCCDFNFKDYPANFQDMFKRAKVNTGKLNHKLGMLTLDKAAHLKPKQTSRAEKNAKLEGVVTLPGVLTHGTLPYNPDAPVQEVKEKPVKAKKVAEKPPAKEGKKKK